MGIGEKHLLKGQKKRPQIKRSSERIRQRRIKQVKEHNHVPKKEREEKRGGGHKNKGNF